MSHFVSSKFSQFYDNLLLTNFFFFFFFYTKRNTHGHFLATKQVLSKARGKERSKQTLGMLRMCFAGHKPRPLKLWRKIKLWREGEALYKIQKYPKACIIDLERSLSKSIVFIEKVRGGVYEVILNRCGKMYH